LSLSKSVPNGSQSGCLAVLSRQPLIRSAHRRPIHTPRGISGASQGGSYTVSGTAGQPDAGVLTGGGYTLTGGYWSGSLAGEYSTYLPMVIH
jgi:hypothetical protein